MHWLVMFLWMTGCIIIEATTKVEDDDATLQDNPIVEDGADEVEAVDSGVDDDEVLRQTCSSCASWVDGPACDPLGMPEAAASRVDRIAVCACGNGEQLSQCAEDCATSTCAGEPASNACKSCLGLWCAESLDTCLSDRI